MRHNSTTVDAFAEVVNVTNHTGMGYVKLTWLLFKFVSIIYKRCLYWFVKNTLLFEMEYMCCGYIRQGTNLSYKKYDPTTTPLITTIYFSVCFPLRGAQSAGVIEYTNCITVEEYDPHPTEWSSWIWHLMVRLQSWNSEKCAVPLHCHYSQVHSD